MIGKFLRGGVLAAVASAVVLAAGTTGASAATYTPISNDCSAGYVAFTFDDGPDITTPAIVQALLGLNLHATFFVNGSKVVEHPAILASEVANGFTVGSHLYDHASMTGVSTGTPPMTDQQVTDQLASASQAIIQAGGTKPTLYRPPYGDVNAYYDLLARNLGYRIVMPWGTNIVDSQDWVTGTDVATVVARVTQGYRQPNGVSKPGITADSIIAMHDGLDPESNITVQALQPIVDYMNAHHLCSAATIRQDATGGAVPPPAPPEPTTGNLVSNPSLETLRTANPAVTAEPLCFQQGGASVASNTATWSLTSDAHSGSVAERVDVANWTAGDRKIVPTQRASEASCLAPVIPGKSYSMWAWYKGQWPYVGAAPTKVSIATYYRNAFGTWVYWQGSTLVSPTSTWNLANWVSAPLPAGATAISFGLAISGIGSLTTDDYALAMNP